MLSNMYNYAYNFLNKFSQNKASSIESSKSLNNFNSVNHSKVKLTAVAYKDTDILGIQISFNTSEQLASFLETFKGTHFNNAIDIQEKNNSVIIKPSLGLDSCGVYKTKRQFYNYRSVDVNGAEDPLTTQVPANEIAISFMDEEVSSKFRSFMGLTLSDTLNTNGAIYFTHNSLVYLNDFTYEISLPENNISSNKNNVVKKP